MQVIQRTLKWDRWHALGTLVLGLAGAGGLSAATAGPAGGPETSASETKATKQEAQTAADGAKAGKPSRRIDLNRIPDTTTEELGQIPKNLAHWNMGATLILAKGKGNFSRLEPQENPNVMNWDKAVLLSDDGSLEYPIQEGEHSFVVDLNGMYSLNRAYLNSYTAQGRVQVSVSDTLKRLDSRRWKNVTDWVSLGERQQINLRFPQIEARYVWFHFDIQKAGDISYLGLYGDVTIAETTYDPRKDNTVQESPTAASQTLNFDLGALYTGSRITHVSTASAQGVNNMIDDDLDTAYNFGSDQEDEIFILDLKGEANVNRVSFLMDSPGGTLEVYLLRIIGGEDDQEQSDAKQSEGDASSTEQQAESGFSGTGSRPRAFIETEQGKRVIDSDFFESRQPELRREMEPGKQRVRFDFEKVPTRFLLVRWVRNESESPPVVSPEAKVASKEGGPGLGEGVDGKVVQGDAAQGDAAQSSAAQSPSSLQIYDATVIAEVPAENFFISSARVQEIQQQSANLITPPGAGDASGPGTGTATEDLQEIPNTSVNSN